MTQIHYEVIKLLDHSCTSNVALRWIECLLWK